MKKSLIALAALAAVGAASAQSSVTLSGTLDTGLEKVNGQATQLSTSRGSAAGTNISLSGVEDLGGGLKGIFKIGTDFDSTFDNKGGQDSIGDSLGSANPNSGTGVNTKLGNDELYVGVTGGFGKVLLGRPVNTLTSFAMTANPVDRGVTGFTAADTLNIDGKYTANAIQYTSPSLYGFTIQGEYGLSEAQNTKSGMALGLRYDNGPLAVSLAAHRGKSVTTDVASGNTTPLTDSFGITTGTTGAIATPASTTNQVGSHIAQFAIAYDFGPAKLYFTNQHNSRIKYYGATALNRDNLKDSRLLGVSVPLGAGTFWAQYGYQEQPDTTGTTTTAGKGTIFGLGYKYNLSKRTSVYAQAATRNNVEALNDTTSGSTVASIKGKTGYGFGIVHNF